MQGFGARCPYCQFWMRTLGQWRLSETTQVALAQCVDCHHRIRFNVTARPLRSYRKKGSKSVSSGPNSTDRKNHRSVPDECKSAGLQPHGFGLGELCPKCQSAMYVRSSRRVSGSHKVFYLDCTSSYCDGRRRADVRGSSLPPQYRRFSPTHPITMRRLLLLK